jgi:hypothetical protein
MISRWIRAAALPAALALGPATTLAFETVDTLRWPSAGLFAPTYVGDPLLPWSIFAYGGTMYDSNVRRTSTAETADWISRIGVGGRYTARVYGRQSIALDGYGEYRSYDELSEFNHFAYGLRGQWLWELGNQLAGTASVSRTQRLEDLAESTTKELIIADRFDLSGAYRFHPDWRLTGGIAGSRVENDSRAVDTTRALGTRGGIAYVSPLGNSVGIELRHAEGEEPIDRPGGIGSFLGNEYEENEAAFTLTYALGETLRLRGRLGYTERTYTDFPASNFSGTTGRGAVDWRVGAKTVLTFVAYRVPDSVIDVDALYVDERGVGMGIHWAPTYKLVLSARALSERRVHRGDVLAASTGLPPRDETTRVIRFGLGWEPERHWQLSTGLDFGTRTSNLLARDYDYTAFMANLRWTY